MKVKPENEELVKVGYRIPANLKKGIEALAIKERRSVNDQVIVIFEKALETVTGKEGEENL